MAKSSRPRAPTVLLAVLTMCFLVRILAQPASLVIDHPLLPRFQSWQSGLVPYPWLLAAQLIILGAMSIVVRRAATGHLVPRRRLGRLLVIVGGVYFVGTVARLAIGLTLEADSPFFAKPVPIVFHMVLASFLLVCGHYHTHAPTVADQTVSDAL